MKYLMKIKIDYADRAFSLWVRTRDGWTCQRCQTPYPPGSRALHNSHFMGRGKENTRYEPLNCDSLCYGCHAFLTAHPAEHYEWQLSRKGQSVIDRLRLASHTYKKKDRASEFLYWQVRLLKDFKVVIDKQGKQVI